MKKLFTLLTLIATLALPGAVQAATFKNAGLHVQEYVWDFAVDGGATGTYVLSAKAGKAPLPTGAIVLDVVAKTETAVTGTNSTYEWGNADTDGYSGTAIAVATLTAAGYVTSCGVGAGALCWDNTNDVVTPYYISSPTVGVFNFKINTAAATAGKIRFYVTYLL